MLFIDNLIYIWYDTYIATVIYRWACLAPVEQGVAKVTQKPETELTQKDNEANSEIKANSLN